MQITRTDVDALNAKVAISIEQVDFTSKVETILKDYKKNANIPGFRKGHVPMGMIKKQYETAVMAEEVNKLLQESLTNYIQEEKLELLGNPLPVMQDEIDWKAEQLSFEFELGFAPNVDVNIKGKKAITQFQIEADKKMIDEQLNHLQKQYGKLEAQSSIDEGFELTLSIINEEAAINTAVSASVKYIPRFANADCRVRHGLVELYAEDMRHSLCVCSGKGRFRFDAAKTWRIRKSEIFRKLGRNRQPP